MGTPSAAMSDDVSLEEKTRRFLILDTLQRATTNKVLDSFVGKEISVLAERASTKNSEELSGHSTCQKLVNFACKTRNLGDIYKVKVTTSKSNTLYGVAL